jgi:hypothetical protein
MMPDQVSNQPASESNQTWGGGQGVLRLLRRNGVYWAIVLAMVLLTLAAAEARITSADLGLYLYAARRILDGATLYVDIIEINPPLVIWLNVPAVLLARSLGLTEPFAYRLTVTAILTTSMLLSQRLVYRSTDDRGSARLFLLLVWFSLFPLAWVDFGQREHMLIGLLIPYLLLAARMPGGAVGMGERVAIGAFAGVGVALKPHFLILWLAIEVWSRCRSRQARWRITPEMLGSVGFLAAYGVVVLAATAYLPMVSVFGPAYAKFMNASRIHALLINPAAPLVLFSLLAYAALRQAPARLVPWGLLAIATAAAYAAGVLQHKGFRYHYYPAFALAMILVGWIAIAAQRSNRMSGRLYRRIIRPLAATIVLMVLGDTAVDAFGHSKQRAATARGLAEIAATVRTRGQGRPIGVLSYSINGAFPLLNESGGVLALRLPCLWPLAAAYWDSLIVGGAVQYRERHQMAPSERYMWDAVRHDLLAADPGLLLVLAPGQDVPANGLRRLNYIAYFSRDPQLEQLFARYQLIGHSGQYLIYEHISSEQARTAPPPALEPLPQVAPRSELSAFTAAMIEPGLKLGVLLFLALWLVSDLLRFGDPPRSRVPAASE